MKTRSCLHCASVRWLIAAAACGCLCSQRSEAGTKAEDDFLAYVASQCGPLRDQFLAAAGEDQGIVKEVANRTETTKKLVGRIAAYYQDIQSGVMMDLIGQEAGTPTRNKRTIGSYAQEAAELVTQNQAALATALPRTGETPATVQAACDYCQAVLAAAERFTAQRGQEADALKVGMAPAELAIVMPLLNHSDDQWNKKLIDAFGAWMKKEQSLKAQQWVCILANHPRAAYELWIYQLGDRDANGIQEAQYCQYLAKQADGLFGSKDFVKGITSLKGAILLADQSKVEEMAISLRFRLAEAYVIYGHCPLAADEMKEILTLYRQCPQYPKAALLRLKYLYEGELFAKVLEEVQALQSDQAAFACRPQITYIWWVTCRREGKTEDAARIQNSFISDYPDHPLCADMHFASAMNCLAGGDYSGASSFLAKILDKFPTSPVAKKAQEVQTKIAAADQLVRAATKPSPSSQPANAKVK